MMTRPAPDEDSARSMNLARMGLFARLTGARSVLIAGCGGGFDVFCGLPLYFALAAEGKRVHLANLSFTRLRAATGRWLTPVCLRIDADTGWMTSRPLPKTDLSLVGLTTVGTTSSKSASIG